ncbi:Hoc-like head decoration [Salmonella phage vB_SnwM_CGG4-1]|uniref:Outer capsid protein Hoc I n=1 Tax=Salmonella phage vB_SnwM_CGG4-1 TaxID=1815631 RepID=A0A1B0VVB4_9CAUD|nr:Hoc-like head decoration [Salmonella phage vB_SnwM_CGG4-1]ANA49522.1 outer capsid protein Hoc I [Salmonella phage vB_SnwM_CGG4-1]
MIGLVIDGPRYALVSQTIFYQTAFILPPGMAVSDVEIHWYKDDILIPQLPTEDPLSLYLYDIDYPAAGTYYALITNKITGVINRSNEIILEIGTEERAVVLDVSTRKYILANVGETVALRPVCEISPDYAERTCTWWRDGVELSPDEDIDILISSEKDYGLYILKSTGTCVGAYKDAYQEIAVDIYPRAGVVCPLIYDNDLNPYLPYGGGRNAAYMWIGWWVWDEILESVLGGHDWRVDIANSNFKYKCELQKVADLINEYPEVDIQESRNGYILNKADLLPKTM